MSNKFHVLDHPMLLYAGFATSGHTKDLQPGIIGIFDAKTSNAVSTLDTKRPIRLAQGSYHTKDSLGAFYTGLKKSTKTADFLPTDVHHIEFSKFQKPQNQKIIFGWDGMNDCNNLAFECGKTHRFRLRVFGEGVYSLFNKQILRDVQVTTGCCADETCGDGCPDDGVHCRKYTQKLVDAINSDFEISKFVKASVVLPEIATKTATHKIMSLDICDNGDQEAQNAVQRQYPTQVIVRTKRVGGTSTYTTGCMLNAATMADFTPSTPVDLAVCNVCPAGYTLSIAKDIYTINANEGTYANAAAVTTAYQNATSKTFNGGTAVNVTTDLFTITNHGFVTGQKVLYGIGGGTVITGLTDATDYYVIKVSANTFKLATTLVNAIAGTAINITVVGVGASHTLKASGFATTLLNSNNVTEVYQLEVTSGITITALSNDMVTFSLTRGAICTPTSPSAVSWTKTEDRFVSTQKKCIILDKTCGGANRLAEVQAAYAGNANIVAVTLKTAGDCEDVYEIEQYSDCFGPDGCLTEERPTFPAILPFENKVWMDCPCETEATPTEANKCGIRLEASSNYTRFGDCSWNPMDYYSFKPTYVEIYAVEDDGEPCKVQPTMREIQPVKLAAQSGEWVAREYINLVSYLYHDAFMSDPRLREVLDLDIWKYIDKSAYYNVYYFKFKQYRGNVNAGNVYDSEIYEIPIVVKEGVNTASFENFLNTTFSPLGVVVRPRIDQPNY